MDLAEDKILKTIIWIPKIIHFSHFLERDMILVALEFECDIVLFVLEPGIL